jgi:hypothetical protein
VRGTPSSHRGVTSAPGGFRWIHGILSVIRHTVLPRHNECMNAGWLDSLGALLIRKYDS